MRCARTITQVATQGRARTVRQTGLPNTAQTTINLPINTITDTTLAPTLAQRHWALRSPAVWLLAPLAGLLLTGLLLVLALAAFGANWARSPLEHLVQAKTGRALHIGGDLQLGLGWPAVRLQAQDLRFANPAWARQPQLLVVDRVDFRVDLPALLRGRLLLPVVQMGQPVVMLEVAPDGRKSWLLDRSQSDDSSGVQVGRLSLRQGQLGYDDVRQKTRLRLQIDTVGNRSDTAVPGPTSGLGARSDVLLSASGTLLGQPMQASGRGGSVLGLRDESSPYPLQLEVSIGATRLRADGRITGLAQLTAVDLQVGLRGGSLAQLDALLGVGLPETRPYATTGRLLHSGSQWRYQGFSGQVGRSDVAGNLQVELSGKRPQLRGDVGSRLLDLADLGPVIGLRQGGLVAAAATEAAIGATPGAATTPALAPTAKPATPQAANIGGNGQNRVLPDLPFKTDRWRALDADLQLSAKQVLRAKALPLDGGSARLQLQDAVLSLDPLRLNSAGGQLSGSLVLDAREAPTQASAKLQARGLQLGQLFPAWDKARTSVGRVHGDVELRGHGSSVGRMLATADGQLRLQAEPGRVSRLLMEQLGLHLLEMLQLSLAGDQTINLRCAVADFSVKQGVMQARTLAVDTAVSSVSGSGQINLAQESIDLVLVPRSRKTSLVALRGPIRLHGPLDAPEVSLDTAGILARGAGALALGLVNPLLALVPLVETSNNTPSPCARASTALGLSAKAVEAPSPHAAPAAPRNETRAGTAPPAPGSSRP